MKKNTQKKQKRRKIKAASQQKRQRAETSGLELDSEDVSRLLTASVVHDSKKKKRR